MIKAVIKVTIVGMSGTRIVPAVFIAAMNTAAGVLAVQILATVFPAFAPLLSISSHNSAGSNDQFVGSPRSGGRPSGWLRHLPDSHDTTTLIKEEKR